MKKEVIITAKTVEEAMSEAYAKYSAEGEVTCEILEMPKKGFLGIGGTPAKIKAIIDDGDDDADISSIINDMRAMKMETDRGGDGSDSAKAAPKEAAPKEAAPKEQAKANTAKEKSVPTQKKSEPKAPRAEKTEKAPKAANTEPKPVPTPRPTPAAEMKAEAPAVKKEQTKANADNTSRKDRYEPVSEVEMQYAVEFVETVIRDLEISATAVPVKDDEGAFVGINIEGENTGVLIGHHGETLDAIQYLANLSASRRSPTPNREFLKITVDIENYREKREETLRGLARRMAAKAIKYKRNFVLEPMNPYERRIIHSEIQQIENVNTHSVGSDDNRKVVVTYEGADKVERRSRSRRNRDNFNAGSTVAEYDPMSPRSYGYTDTSDSTAEKD